MANCRITRMTADQPGAIAIVQLVGDVVPVLGALTGVGEWVVGRLRLVSFDGIDEGLAVRLRDDVAQVMPHGGVRVVQRVLERLAELGAEVARASDVDVRAIYPEAADEYEALMLSALGRAASPMAVELLLREPLKRPGLAGGAQEFTEEERERSARLNRLIDPPLVVLVGPPNVGKSTLSNALLGRSMSIAVDMPGTTRDYTAALVELAGLVVQWHDTPGIRESDDPIERRAIAIARSLIERAEFLIAMTDAEHDWPQLNRPPHLQVVNKTDIARRDDGDLHVSAISGEGMEELVRAVRDALVPPADIEALETSKWVFDARLMNTRD